MCARWQWQHSASCVEFAISHSGDCGVVTLCSLVEVLSIRTDRQVAYSTWHLRLVNPLYGLLWDPEEGGRTLIPGRKVQQLLGNVELLPVPN